MRKPKKTFGTDDNSPLRRLTFLRQFMLALHIREKDAAAALGCTDVTVNRWFRPSVDDCTLKSAQALCAAYGHTLAVQLYRGDIPQDEQRIIHGSGDRRTEIIVRTQGGASPRGRRGAEPARLDFLYEALDEAGVSTGELAERMGLYPTTIGYMFRNDDLPVSRIYEIAAALDMSIRFSIKPDAQHYDASRRWCVNDLTLAGPIVDGPEQDTP